LSGFYDTIAPFHHLIFADWERSIERQARQLADIIEARWGTGIRSILDVSCGIGTQALGLAGRGYRVTASDLSERAIERARAEAQGRGLAIDFSVGDMRAASDHHHGPFDVVISCDNSLPHLLSDDEILLALGQLHACARLGGGCLLSVRDYDREPRGRGIVKPYGVREAKDERVVIFQVWDFEGALYDLSMYFVVEDRATGKATTHVATTKYYAIGTDRLMALMEQAGFTAVARLDEPFYQPVLLGDRRE
jgi:SAM-dependent methyltransferase